MQDLHYQGVEVVHVAGESDLWRADTNGRLDVTAVGDML